MDERHAFRLIRVLESKRDTLQRPMVDEGGDPITVWVDAWVCDRCGCRTVQHEIAPLTCVQR